MKINAINLVNFFKSVFTIDYGKLPTMLEINILNRLNNIMLNIDDVIKIINIAYLTINRVDLIIFHRVLSQK